MNIIVSRTKDEMGRKAAEQGAGIIRQAISQKGTASIVVATGASQFEMLQHLVRQDKIDWLKVTAFHLDEYIGIPVTHKASFRKYLKERFVEKLSPGIGSFHYIQPGTNPQKECERLGQLISNEDIDVAFIGIGENGHIAFNDPPADFDTDEPYIVVGLDEACRRQQMGEGWFPSIEDVPTEAISMSVRQIMKSKNIICSVPDKRKAGAVKNCMEGEITNLHPASVLQNHKKCTVYLDTESASLLRPEAGEGSPYQEEI